jgi:ADP-ribosylglycohydrolase
LCGAAHGADEKEYANYIYKCYLDWLRTQKGSGVPMKGKTAWLNDLIELHELRAPGGTCLRSLSSGKKGSVEKHINDRKGCGGVMRAAPVGLLFEDEGMCARIGAESAAITHGNALGYLPAAVLASTVRELVMNEEMSVREAVLSAKRTMNEEFPHEDDVQTMNELIDRALELAADDLADDLDALYELGEGWVGEEALAVAIYCAVKYDDDFEKCMIAAVNHSGDSDSTGAVAGNILGAKLGMKGIPEYYLKDLELREVLVQMADDLYAARLSMGWQKKYL